MIKEYCDRCKTEIIKDRKKNICFDCDPTLGGLIGKIDITVCLLCQKEIKNFATKTKPFQSMKRIFITGKDCVIPETDPGKISKGQKQ